MFCFLELLDFTHDVTMVVLDLWQLLLHLGDLNVSSDSLTTQEKAPSPLTKQTNWNKMTSLCRFIKKKCCKNISAASPQRCLQIQNIKHNTTHAGSICYRSVTLHLIITTGFWCQQTTRFSVTCKKTGANLRSNHLVASCITLAPQNSLYIFFFTSRLNKNY